MYIVICPQCQKRLKLSQPLEKKKFKCSVCAHVFVGTAQPADSVPKAAKPPATTKASKAEARPAEPRPAEPPAAPVEATPAMPIAAPAYDAPDADDASAPAAEPVDPAAPADVAADTPAAPVARAEEPPPAETPAPAEPQPVAEATPPAVVASTPVPPAEDKPADVTPAQTPAAVAMEASAPAAEAAPPAETKPVEPAPVPAAQADIAPPPAEEKKTDGFGFDFSSMAEERAASPTAAIPAPEPEKPKPAKKPSAKPGGEKSKSASSAAASPGKAAPIKSAAGAKLVAKSDAKPKIKPGSSSDKPAGDVPREAAAIMAAVSASRPSARSRTIPTVRAKSKMPLIVVGGCGVMLIPLIISVWFFSTHSKVIDPRTGQEYVNPETGKPYGYVTKDEHKRIQEEIDEKNKPAPPPEPRPAAATEDPGTVAVRTPDREPPVSTAQQTPAALANAGTSGGETTTQPDDPIIKPVASTGEVLPLPEGGGVEIYPRDLEGLEVNVAVVPPTVEDGKYALIGTITNETDEAIEQLAVTVILDPVVARRSAGIASDIGQDSKQASIAFINVGTTAPVYVDLGRPVDKMKPQVIVSVLPADRAGYTLWEICNPEDDVMKERLDFVYDSSGKNEMTVSGTISNSSGPKRDLRNVRLFVDVYAYEGKTMTQLLGSVEITSTDAPDLEDFGIGKSAKISVTFECERAPERNLRKYVRAAGIKPDIKRDDYDDED